MLSAGVPEFVRFGIDNGASGALVVLDRNADPVIALRAPVRRIPGPGKTAKLVTIPDVIAITQAIRRIGISAWPHGALEWSQVMRGGGEGKQMGAVAAMTFGRLYQGWHQALTVEGVSFEEVRPGTWQRELYGWSPGARTKEVAIEVCREVVPGLDLTPGRLKLPHEGLAEACCLALWAWKQQPGTVTPPARVAQLFAEGWP